MRRVLVLGPPGSGKSTLARWLGERHGLPVFHLDQAYWRPGWVPADPEAFRDEVRRIAGLSAWVIDGNYSFAMAPRIEAADTVIYLDVPAWRCLLRLVRRIVGHRGRVRLDMTPGCPERLDIAFLRFAASWNRQRRACSLAMVERFGGRSLVLRSGDRFPDPANAPLWSSGPQP